MLGVLLGRKPTSQSFIHFRVLSCAHKLFGSAHHKEKVHDQRISQTDRCLRDAQRPHKWPLGGDAAHTRETEETEETEERHTRRRR